MEPGACRRARVGDRRRRGRPKRSTSSRPWRRRRTRRRGRARPGAAGRPRRPAPVRSSRPRIFAAFSTEECACSDATTTGLSGASSRAAARPTSVDVEAVSSMCPCQPAGKPEQVGDPVEDDAFELGRRGRRAPEDRVLVDASPRAARRGSPARSSRSRSTRSSAATASASSPGSRISSSRARTAENGSPRVGRSTEAAASAPSPGSTCASTGSSSTRSR